LEEGDISIAAIAIAKPPSCAIEREVEVILYLSIILLLKVKEGAPLLSF
jgi:hypothetical protein